MIPQKIQDCAGYRMSQTIATAITLDHPHAKLGDWLGACGYLTTIMLENAKMTKEQRLSLVLEYSAKLLECVQAMTD